jgi:hypothetical protein
VSAAAKSIVIFAGYMFALGVVLLVAPNPFLVAFGFAPTSEPWVRLVGVLVLCLAGYYALAARRELVAFISATVWGRGFVAVCLVALVALGIAPAPLIVFAVIDVVGAAWTAVALWRKP